jgi:hypothetical protein
MNHLVYLSVAVAGTEVDCTYKQQKQAKYYIISNSMYLRVYRSINFKGTCLGLATIILPLINNVFQK